MAERDPYADFREDPDEVVQSNNLVHTLRSMAQEQVDAEALVASLEEQLSDAKERLRDIKEDRLPGIMDQIELENYSTKDGITIEVKENIRGSIPKATEDEAFKWLEDHNNENLIKRQFLIEFAKDQEKWANRFAADLRRRKRPLNTKVKRAVNPQSLQAFVKSQLSEGVDFPMKLFGVYRQRFSKVTVKDKS